MEPFGKDWGYGLVGGGVWVMILGFSKDHKIPSDSFFFMFMDQDVISQLPVQHYAYQSAVKFHAMMAKDSNPWRYKF